MLVELSKLIRKDVSIWHEVIVLLAEPLLHPHDVEAKSILPGDFMTLREMVDFLVFVKTLIQVALAR
tara:strand:- start:1236 stop:1436 length:201 start_codon:yes stop_codon:yes gene_type:complete